MWKEIKRIGHYVVYEDGDKQITVYKPIKAKRGKKSLLQRLKGEK